MFLALLPKKRGIAKGCVTNPKRLCRKRLFGFVRGCSCLIHFRLCVSLHLSTFVCICSRLLVFAHGMNRYFPGKPAESIRGIECVLRRRKPSLWPHSPSLMPVAFAGIDLQPLLPDRWASSSQSSGGCASGRCAYKAGLQAVIENKQLSLRFGEVGRATKPYRTSLAIIPGGLISSSVQKRPFVHNSVCSQFLEGLFAILAECSQFCLRPL